MSCLALYDGTSVRWINICVNVDPPLDLPSGSRICLFNGPSGVTLAMIAAPKQ
jgi:hypothetical protein